MNDPPAMISIGSEAWPMPLMNQVPMIQQTTPRRHGEQTRP